MVRSANSGVKKATEGSSCTPLQQDEALCHMTHRLDRTSFETDKQLYITSPDKLFVPHKVSEFLSLTPAKSTIFVRSTPPKLPGRGSGAHVGGGRAQIASNCAAFFQ
jgi:hypothetical protein